MSEPPAGHIGTPEAAKLLGVHQQTIRNYVRDGRLIGFKEYDPETKRERYWVTRESAQELAGASQEHLETADQLARRTEDVLERIASQEESMGQRLLQLHENLNTRLNRVEDRQIGAAKNLERAVDILDRIEDRSRSFQDEMLEILKEEREYLRKQREELGHEERRARGFWARLFGAR